MRSAADFHADEGADLNREARQLAAVEGDPMCPDCRKVETQCVCMSAEDKLEEARALVRRLYHTSSVPQYQDHHEAITAARWAIHRWKEEA
jgi:hypothetical protein